MIWHIGRSWDGHHIEDTCPCPQAACGLIPQPDARPDCPEHACTSCKTIRQSHPADQCPATGALEAAYALPVAERTSP